MKSFVEEYRGRRIVSNGEFFGIEDELITDSLPSDFCVLALRCHKQSKTDDSAKADALLTGDANDLVWGVVYEIANKERRAALSESTHRSVATLAVDGGESFCTTTRSAGPSIHLAVR